MQNNRNRKSHYRDEPIRIEWLRKTLAQLDDDFTRPWSDYPCLEWPFSLQPSGYGQVSYEGHPTTVHRMSLIITVGDIAGFYACHHCDNPPCFRPIHLFKGTAEDNALDMVRNQRHPARKKKLTFEEYMRRPAF